MINKLTLILLGAALLVAQTGGPATFNSPEEARDGLMQAAEKGRDSLIALFGPWLVRIRVSPLGSRRIFAC